MPSATFTIRKSTHNDTIEISNVLRSSYQELFVGYYRPELIKIAVAKMGTANPQLIESGRYYVAVRSDGVLVGCGGWSLRAPNGHAEGAHIAHLRHFAVDPRYSNKGAGGAIYHQCEVDAVKTGVRIFHCSSSLMAEGFYARLGFEQKRYSQIKLDRETMAIVEMTKRLV